jgi:hypothetical protein
MASTSHNAPEGDPSRPPKGAERGPAAAGDGVVRPLAVVHVIATKQVLARRHTGAQQR